MARAGSGALLVGTYREVAADCRTQIVFDNDGRLHFAALEPEPEPASLLDLLAAVNAMLPRVDLSEVLLEVFSGPADQAFTSINSGTPEWSMPREGPGRAAGGGSRRS